MFGRITRDDAIDTVGLNAVEAVESENVKFTNRVCDSTNPGMVEFSASVDLTGDRHLVMYCYQDADEAKAAEELDQLDWVEAIENAEYEVCE